MRGSVAGGRRSPASLARIAPALQGAAQRGDRVGRHPLGDGGVRGERRTVERARVQVQIHRHVRLGEPARVLDLELVLDLAEVWLVVTGEGSLNEQTLAARRL
jgi:hypothetical protein